jgi:monofunctional biosynthetic peptidoglycan transglycosylase
MVLPNPEKYSQSYYRKNLTKFARKRISRIVHNLHRFGRLDEAAYEEAINNVDYFLKGEKAPPKAEEEIEGDLANDEISDEDLEKIINETNEEPSQENSSENTSMGNLDQKNNPEKTLKDSSESKIK